MALRTNADKIVVTPEAKSVPVPKYNSSEGTGQRLHFGEQAFRDRLLEMVKKKNQNDSRSPSRSIARDFRQAKDDEIGHRIIEAGLKYYNLSQNDLPTLRKGDERKSMIAGLITEKTNLPLKWIAENLHTGSPGYTSRLAIRANQLSVEDKRIMAVRKKIIRNVS